jgi:hypothetical protein
MASPAPIYVGTSWPILPVEPCLHLLSHCTSVTFNCLKTTDGAPLFYLHLHLSYPFHHIWVQASTPVASFPISIIRSWIIPTYLKSQVILPVDARTRPYFWYSSLSHPPFIIYRLPLLVHRSQIAIVLHTLAIHPLPRTFAPTVFSKTQLSTCLTPISIFEAFFAQVLFLLHRQISTHLPSQFFRTVFSPHIFPNDSLEIAEDHIWIELHTVWGTIHVLPEPCHSHSYLKFFYPSPYLVIESPVRSGYLPFRGSNRLVIVPKWQLTEPDCH